MTSRSPEALVDPDNFDTESIASFPSNIEDLIHNMPFSFGKQVTSTLMEEGFKFRAIINGRSFEEQATADAERTRADERPLWQGARARLGKILGWFEEQI